MVVFELWHFWVLLGIALIIGEMFTLGFFLACFGVGAFVVAIIALLGTGLVFQVLIFSVLSFICIFAIRPFLLRISSKKENLVRTGVDALTGKTGLVLQAFGGSVGHGSVKIGGEIWRAMGMEGEIFSKDDLIVVESIRGTTLVVQRAHKN